MDDPREQLGLCKSCQAEKRISADFSLGKTCIENTTVWRCEFCDLHTPLDGTPLKMCANCKVTTYCGRRCQRSDWPFHRQWCEELPKIYEKFNYTKAKKKQKKATRSRRSVPPQKKALRDE